MEKLEGKRWGAGKEWRVAGWEGRRAEEDMRRGDVGRRAEG